MEWIAVSVTCAIGVALICCLLWVAWRYDQPAGVWWAGAGFLAAADNLVVLAQGPAFLLPLATDVIAPLASWLCYRGAVAHVREEPHPFPAVAAVAGTLLWLGLYAMGAPPWTTASVAVGVGIPMLVVTAHKVGKAAQTVAGRLFVGAIMAPILLLATGHLMTSQGVPRETEAAIWLGVLASVTLLAICMAFERHLSETNRMLRQREAQLRLGAQIAGMGTWTLDYERSQVQWSAEVFGLYGLSPDDPVPTWSELLSMVAEEDREVADRAIREAWEDRGELDVEFRIEPPGGGTRYVASRARYLEMDGGEGLLVGTSMDVTAHRTALEELRRYRNHLEELVDQRTTELEASRQKLHVSERLASLGTLSAGLAHQINNPVGSIVAAAGFAERCRDDSDELEVLRRAVADIDHEAKRCGEIVRNMLRFASDQPTDKKVIPIDPMIMRTCHAVRRRVQEGEATVTVEADGPSPVVNASSLELELALANLLENAVQSRQRGARVRVRRLVRDDEVHVEICDDGWGIPAESLGRVLDPFFTSRLESGGTGLGLSVAHGIAREHDGSLSIDSQPGRGTTVVLALPLAD